jgi:hypothetical protein
MRFAVGNHGMRVPKKSTPFVKIRILTRLLDV